MIDSKKTGKHSKAAYRRFNAAIFDKASPCDDCPRADFCMAKNTQCAAFVRYAKSGKILINLRGKNIRLITDDVDGS